MSEREYEFHPYKLHTAMAGKSLFLVQPSSKYPACWWVCKIENSAWEGFGRPLTQFGFDYWRKSLPEGLEWTSHKWDGNEMAVPLETADRHKSRSDRVYFLEAVGLNRIKIGLCTGDPEVRTSQLRLLSPVELRVVGTIPGDVKTEHALHERFQMSRIHGEWFEFDDDIREYIKLNCGDNK